MLSRNRNELQWNFWLKLFRFDTEAVKTVEVSKPKAEDDLNAEETSSEEEDDLTREGQELKDMLDREEGRESWDEEEEDPDQDDIKGTSALFLQGLKEPGYTIVNLVNTT